MNTPSPFAEVQRIQDEQREGWVPARKLPTPTPRTDAAIQSINEAHFRGKIIAPIFAATLELELAAKDAKIAEQAGQIVALRGCLEHLRSKDWFNNPYYTTEVVGIINASKVRAALSTPAPKVVPLEEAKALADALENLRDEQNGPPLERHKEHWQAAYDTANKVLAEFNSKHPL